MSAIAAAPSDDRTRPGAILIGCLVGFLVGEIIATVLVAVAIQLAHYPGGLHALGQSKAPPWWSNVGSLTGLWAGFAGAIFFATTVGRLTALPQPWRIKPSDSLYILLGAACQAVVALAYGPFHFKSLSQPVHHLFGGARGVTFALLAVMTTLVAPLIEEWFFRGVLYRALHEGLTRAAPRWGAAGAVLLSAILFALAHGEPLQFAGLAFLGVVLAVLVRRTQRLVPSVITHVSFNGVAIIALLMQRSGH